MSRYQATLSADGNVQLVDVHRRRSAPSYEGTLIVQGTLGGGTVSLLISGDRGVTLVPFPDVNGSVAGVTAAGARNYRIPGDGGTLNGDAPRIYAQITGSTAPSVTVIWFDNV